MKISNHLIKLLRLTCGQHNDKLSREYTAKHHTAEATVLNNNAAELARLQQLKADAKTISQEVEKIKSTLAKRGVGFQYQGPRKQDEPYLADLKAAGVHLPLPSHKKVDEILVELAAATDEDGLKILATHGVRL